MAFYRTIVARTGFVGEMIAHLEGRSALIGKSGQWLGGVADDETGAIEAGTEYFEENSAGYVVAPESVEAWDITDFTGEIIIGWSITGDGWVEEDEN
jgi:hypothetical protein